MKEKRLGEVKYSHIFSPAKLGKFEVKNRVKWAACSVSNFNTRDGLITDREYARMEVVAQTGCGIITNQGAYPDPRGEGKAYYCQLCIADDRYIPGFRRIADLIHSYDAVAIQQILHAGRYGGIDLGYCVQPSAVPQTLRHFQPPRAMSKAEIRQCIQDHVDASRRSLEAGFDGVEVTAFMGYLLANFASSFTNQRTDEYGGSVQNRGRFMVELIESIKEEIGDAPLIIRLNGEEFMDEYGGSTPDECIEFMVMAEKAGVDMVSIVVGWHESRTGALGRDVPSDGWLYLAERAKAALTVPIAFGPRFGDPLLAERALADGVIDYWEVCRPMLADPLLLHKVAGDRLDEIKPCLGGLMCLAKMFANQPYVCTVNPRLGHEIEPAYSLTPAPVKKRVMVIGGGPAGLECAVVAARRGHDVEVYEKSDRLGGQLNWAAKEVGGGDVFHKLVAHYQAEMRNHGVTVHLETEVTPKLCRQMSPDVAVVATGADLSMMPLPHHDGASVVLATDVLDGKVETGDRVVVLSGERAGLVTAEYLADRGKQVTIIEPGRRIASDVISTFRWRHYAWIQEFGIETITDARVKEISAEGVLVEDDEGTARLVPADTVVVAGPRKSRQELIQTLEFACDELYTIGDAVRPRAIANAIRDGYLVGVRI